MLHGPLLGTLHARIRPGIVALHRKPERRSWNIYYCPIAWPMRVSRWTSTTQGICSAPPPTSAANKALSRIDVAECLEGAGGNQELVRRMIVRFRRENEGMVDRLRDTLGSGAWSQALEILQTLQARSRAIAAQRVSAAAEAVERAVRRSGDWSTQVSMLELEVNQVLTSAEELRRVRHEGDAAGGQRNLSPDDMETLAALLGELSGYLAENRYGACLVFEKIRELLAGSSCQSVVKRLEESLEEFDFIRAERCVQDISEALGLPGPDR